MKNYNFLKKIGILLLFSLIVNNVLGQTAQVINPSGGASPDFDDGLKIVVNPNGALSVYRANLAQYCCSQVWPNGQGYGVNLLLRFSQGTSYNTTDKSLISCSTTSVIQNGNDWYTSIAGYVQSPISGEQFYITMNFSYTYPNKYFNVDYYVRAPYTATYVNPETVHIYLDHDANIKGSDGSRSMVVQNETGHFVGDYRLSTDNSSSCARYSSGVSPSCHGFKVSGLFRSYYSSNYGSRNTKNSSNMLYNTLSTSCVDDGVAVEITVGPLARGEIGVKRIMHCYGDTQGEFNNVPVNDPTPPSGSSSPVSINFTSSTFSETEGNASHTAGTIQITVGGGTLAQDQVCNFTATNGTAIENTDYSYVKGFIIPAGNYTTPVTFTLNDFTIIGNTNCQSNRTFNISIDSEVCNDLVQPGANRTSIVTIVDDDMPTVNQPENGGPYCPGTVIPATTWVFSGSPVPNTSYEWTATNASDIGLSASSGTGNIPAFTTVNATNAPIVSTVTVTPKQGTCSGTVKTFTITVNPLPVLTQPSNQTICSGENTTAVNFAGTNVDVATSTWTVTTGSGTGIGMSANSGTGNIPAFTAVNTDSSPVAVTITVTPKSAVGCTGTTQTFTITVNPLPVLTQPSNQTLCAGETSAAVNFAGTNVNAATSTWAVTTGSGTGIGMPANDGTGNIPAFTAVNTGSSPVAVTITVTPKSTAGCTGTTRTFTFTINPLPVPSFVSGPSGAAKGQSGVVYTTEPGMNNYTWTISGGSITSGGNGQNTATVTWGTVSPGIITVTYKSPAGCSAASAASKTVILSDQNVPQITGTTSVCPDDIVTYITENNKYNYSWTIVGGTPQSGGGNTNSITVKWDGTVAPSVKVSYRHGADTGLPLVDATENITKKAATVITTAPVGATVCYNTTHSMNVVATCQDSPSFQWYKDNTAISGATTSSYIASTTGEYKVTVTGGCGSVTSTPVTVTVKAQPVATINGLTTSTSTVVQTQRVTYTAPPGHSNYIWNFAGGTRFSGGNTGDNSITIDWGTGSSGNVSVSYTDNGCPTTTATVNVTILPQGTPVIISPITDVCLNTSQTYTTQPGKFNYLWTITGNGTISGAANSESVTVNWNATGSGTIKVAYSEVPAATAMESAPISVTIHDVPTIAVLSAPNGVCDNTALTLTTPPITGSTTFPVTSGSWILNSTPFTSGNSVSYTQNGQNLYYEVTNACGSNQSNTVQITVYELPAVTTTAQSICPGTSVDLVATVTNPDGHALSFYTASTGGMAIVDPTVMPATTTTYYVSATNSTTGCVSAPRVPVTITLKTVTQITVQPVDPSTVGIGNPFTLSVTAVGENLTYQWYKDNTLIPGAQSDTYTVSSASTSDYGIYHVTVSGDCGTPKTSNSVIVNILSPDATLRDLLVNGVSVPEFDPQITEYVYYEACDVDLADVIGIPNHPNATVVNRTGYSIEPGDNWFSIVVTAENGFTTKTYTVNVIRDCYIPKILKDLEDAIVCIGKSHTFELIVEGENLTYEWYYGNNRIWGVTGNTYTVHVSELLDYERYYVIIRSNFNGYRASAYSKNVRLWVAEYLPETLKFVDYPNPAVTGNTYHLKLAGYIDVTKYSWSYSKEDVTFSPEIGEPSENETWATFGTLSEGTGTLKVTLEHPCGTREATQAITVKYPTGMETVTANAVAVYPNPTAGIVSVSGTRADQLIRITDVTGSLKGSYKTAEGTTTIDLTAYAKGTYLLQYDGKIFKVIRK
ncbi:MAG: T9SS type A sorting domain-containing protein [Dysgonamonadaceae bacterium]|jgi:hypothetical protein|nr:T9SS type A sorting domain-containing protein [Dysgonamonadaceae bacterium]